MFSDSIKKKRHSFPVLHVDTFEFLAFPYIKTWECVCRSKYHFIKLKYWKYPNKTFARNSGQLSCLHIQMICSYTIWSYRKLYHIIFFCGGSCLFLLDFVRPNKSRDLRFIFEYISTICTNESLNRKWESFYVTFSNMFVNYFP